MDLSLGYKQTHLGVIPEDWELKQLKQISPAQSVGLVINPSTYVAEGGTVPMLVGSNIQPNKIDWENARRISALSNQSLPASRLYAGDLVTVRVGEPGITAVVPAELDGCNCASVMIVRRHDSFDSNWLCYVMNSRAGLSQVENVQYGTAQKQFNISDAVNFLYATPPLLEQHAIAAALSDVDTLLAKLDQLIAKKRDLKQAAMQQLLTGQTRLPGFGGEWLSKPLRHLVREFIVPMRDKPKRLTGHIPWCRIEDFDGMYLSGSKSGQCVDEQTVREMNLKVLPIGTLLVSCSADLGRCAIVGRPLVSNQTFIGLHMDEAVCSVEFFYYLMTFKAEELNNLSSGTTISYLSREQFEAFPVFVAPSKAEQAEIATVLADMDADVAAVESRRDKTRALKQGMMQELLTGRIRLI